MKIMAAALIALGIVALPATYAEARPYHRHHGPVIVVGPSHHWHRHREWHPSHHRWYGHGYRHHQSHS